MMFFILVLTNMECLQQFALIVCILILQTCKKSVMPVLLTSGNQSGSLVSFLESAFKQVQP